MSVIVFAPPQPDLALQPSEVATMINAFHRPLLAHTEDELRRCIEGATDEIEGFWFIGHSGPDGIVANNQTLSPAVIGQYLSTAGVQWSYFSSCESAAFIRDLQAVYPHDAYAYITEIVDLPAWRTAALIAAKYADVGDIHRAVKVAAPANATTLRFFPGSSGVGGRMPQRDIDHLSAQMTVLSGQVNDMTVQLKEFNRVLTGSERFQERGLIETVRQLKDQYTHLEQQYSNVISQIERQTFWWRMSGVGWIIVIAFELFRYGG